MNTISGALIAALISFINAVMALFMNDPELTFAMIAQATWFSMIVGGATHFFKDYQAISTRRILNKLTNSGDGGGSV